MNIAQIIILTVLGLIICGLGLRFYIKSKIQDGTEIIIFMVASGMLIVITVFSLITTSQLQKEMKCPELEKVENVYRFVTK